MEENRTDHSILGFFWLLRKRYYLSFEHRIMLFHLSGPKCPKSNGSQGKWVPRQMGLEAKRSRGKWVWRQMGLEANGSGGEWVSRRLCRRRLCPRQVCRRRFALSPPDTCFRVFSSIPNPVSFSPLLALTLRAARTFDEKATLIKDLNRRRRAAVGFCPRNGAFADQRPMPSSSSSFDPRGVLDPHSPSESQP